MIFVGYEYGKDYIGAPVLGLFVFCLYTISMGIVSDFLLELYELFDEDSISV